MRILYVLNDFPAVSETFVVRQIAAVLARGHEVRIVADRPEAAVPLSPDAQRLLPWVRYRAPRPARTAARLWLHARNLAGAAVQQPRAALRLLMPPPSAARWPQRGVLQALRPYLQDAFAPDVVHCQFGNLGIEAAELALRGLLRAPLLVSFRGFDATRLPRREGVDCYRSLFGQLDAALPVSQSLRRHLLQLGCPPDRIRVHHSGLNLAAWPWSPRSAPRGAPLRLLAVGRLTEKKGFDDLVRALAGALHGGLDARLRLVGEGPMRSALERLVAECGLADRVALVGAAPGDRVRELMLDSDLLVVPSRIAASGDEEGIPNVLKEAMALGLPVLASRHAGIPELVEHGVNGWLADEGSPASLAEALLEACRGVDRWPALALAARARIERDFDAEALADELCELYAALATARAGTRRYA
jgi:colanic acid/amylovoran biosynthesis glycosyltransferase